MCADFHHVNIPRINGLTKNVLFSGLINLDD
jgi:hypothetical protein